MAELEDELRRTLRDPARDVAFAADPVSAVQRGMRRRARRRVASGAAAAAVTAFAIVLATTQLGDRGDGPVQPVESATSTPAAVTTAAPTPSPSQPPSSPAVSAPASSASAASFAPASPPPSSGPAAGSTASATPAGLTGLDVVDLSFIGPNIGWLLGRSTCVKEPCTTILKTVDGGASWQPATAPAADLTPEGAMCSGRDCIDQIRFASASVGYAFGGAQFMTSDAGATWRRSTGPNVLALEASGGDVVRVATTTYGCPPGCTYAVQKSAVGSSTWTTLQTPVLQGVGARLLRHGDDVYVFIDQHTAGGAGDAHTTIAVSHDRGATWRTRPDPCSPVDPTLTLPESDAVDAAIGINGTLVMLCNPRGPGERTLRISHDAGETYGAAVAIPQNLSAGHIAVGAEQIVVSAGNGSTAELLLSTDAGATFRVVASTPQLEGSSGHFLAFTTALVGTWTGPNGTKLWRTADGGATWTERPFG